MQKKLAIIIIVLFSMHFFVSCSRELADVKAVFTLNCENNETLPCIVNFENQSLNSDSYLWNFGDGTVSTEENPTHQYNQKGDYKIILTANNKAGTDTVSQMFSVYDYRDKWIGFYNCDVYKENHSYNSNNDLIINYDTVTDIVEVEMTGDSLLIMSMLTNLIPSGYVITALLKEDGSFNSSYDSSGLWGFNGNFVNDSVYLYFVIGGHSGETEYRYCGAKNNN